MGKRERRLLPFKISRKEKQALSLQNGSMLLEDRFSSCNGRGSPIYSFSIQDLINSTNNFFELNVISSGLWCRMCKGTFKNRPIFVKMLNQNSAISSRLHAAPAIHDIAIASQLSNHKNILKLIGCCLELQTPAPVYEYEGCELLSDLLNNGNDDRLSWKIRLSIAKDISNAVAYLHNAFSAPILHANLSTKKVIIDQYGVAKLFDFSLSIALHPGESQAKDVGVGCMTLSLDPEYQQTGIATTKIDVYGFGVMLLVLLTGEQFVGGSAGNLFYINDQGKKHIPEDNLHQIIDSRILEGGGAQKEQQLQAFFELALSCVQGKGENRPDIIEVAKELGQIEKAFHS